MKLFDIRNSGRHLVRYRLLVMLIAVAVFGGLSLPDFLTVHTFQSILDRASIIGLLALALTPLLIAGQIDLSIGSILSLSGVSTIYFQPIVGDVPAALIGLAVGVVVGLINAALVVLLKISSLVATLATLLIFASLALLVTNSQPLSSADPLFGISLTSDFLAILSPRSALFVLAAVLMFGWLRTTPSGRNLYAVGSNLPAATSAGLNANGYLVATFVISGFFAGAAGVLQSLSTATGSPIAGATVLIPALTAVVIGGTRLEGGRGSSLATLGGVLALGALTTLLEYNNVPAYTQAVYTGVLLILLITLDSLAGRDPSSILRAHRRARLTPTTPTNA